MPGPVRPCSSRASSTIPGSPPEHARRVPRVGLGGAPVPVALGERAAAHGITIMRAYGSTEHPSITGSMFDDPAAKRHATDGRPMPGVEIRLRDDDGAPVPTGVPGEIWSRGPDLCVGYTDAGAHGAARSTTTAGTAPATWASSTPTASSRSPTGINDVIIRGGENISAAEVEQVIAAMPEVAEVAVVAAPDARLGEHACAVVRLASGVTVAAARRRHRRARAGRAGPPEVARGAARRRRLPPHRHRQDPQGRSPVAAPRGRAR